MTLFDKAVNFATERHSGQTRKLGRIPYIIHPMEVASIVATMTEDEEILAAAVLHDTVEDTDTTLEEIKENFGERVYLTVMTETEDKREEVPPEDSWHIRKLESLVILSHTKDIAVKMLWLGDKLSNMRAFYREYRRHGDALWQKFHQKDPAEQAWYYRTIAECLAELRDYDAYHEYVMLTEKVFENVKEDRYYEIK